MLFFLCDLSGLGVRGFFPHAEDAKDAKAGAAAPWDGRPSLLFWRFWPEIFESMNRGLPNQSVERMRWSHRLRPTVPGCRPVILPATFSGFRRRIAHLFRSVV